MSSSPLNAHAEYQARESRASCCRVFNNSITLWSGVLLILMPLKTGVVCYWYMALLLYLFIIHTHLLLPLTANLGAACAPLSALNLMKNAFAGGKTARWNKRLRPIYGEFWLIESYYLLLLRFWSLQPILHASLWQVLKYHHIFLHYFWSVDWENFVSCGEWLQQLLLCQGTVNNLRFHTN